MSDTVEADGASASNWYFTENGQRKGPITTANLLELLEVEKISGDTPVWLKGLADWQPLRNTELAGRLQDTPPPVAPNFVNNSLVWTLAIAPIGYAFLAGWRDMQIMEDPLGDHSFAQFVALGLPLLLNATLCLIDEQQLKRAGYADKWLTLFGILLAPVYLFLRAKRLRQTPTYGYTWVVSFIVSILLSIPH
ncbi:DUF4339 domain-containing protein [Bradyrhizobium sp. URHD0069]|uniref:DUF4339 domain-containing protein n=1 Tax=Bradyrhizobium sp. URHD0069 TaxID=1380355 RepID=UPI0004981333|nr:DUF4339 domain-containing protein [Bradyrhizobium sp. URHD0069]